MDISAAAEMIIIICHSLTQNPDPVLLGHFRLASHNSISYLDFGYVLFLDGPEIGR